jgi:cytochrome c oxidase subunit IV
MKPLMIRLHVVAGVALLSLLALTVGTSFIRMGGWNLVTNLVIAGAKACIVLVWFMRIGRSGVSTRFAAAAGVAWLMLLFGLALTDFLWR